MLNSELGERRWKVFKSPECWLKISEMVVALVAIALCVPFDQTAMVHMKDTQLSYIVSLKFPFIYKENVTVTTPPVISIPEFKFPSTLLPSALLFVVVNSIALVSAIVIFSLFIVRRRTQTANGLVTWYFFAALTIAFLVLMSTSFWVSNLIRLKDNVNEDIEAILRLCRRDGNGKCVDKLPNYITLYLSTAFAFFLDFLWLVDCVLNYITLTRTIPQLSSRTTLIQNVEMPAIQN